MFTRRLVRRGPITVASWLVIACAGTGAWSPTSARADDPPFLGWSATLPPGYASYRPSSADDCLAGRIQCVDQVIHTMTRRFSALRCDHNSAFALTYLRTTEEYRRSATTPGFFSDPAFVNHEDKVFADIYFGAYDNWRSGKGPVPAAWRIAFEAAAGRKVSAAGNMTLGVNAHVNRDLPFVLYAIGLVKADGSSRKPDHDKVNEFLNRVSVPLTAEIAARLDPTIDDGNLPTLLDDVVSFQLIPSWRERAWRNAELLAQAPTAEARTLIARQIESTAAEQALTLRESARYLPLDMAAQAARDAFCTAHFDDWPG